MLHMTIGLVNMPGLVMYGMVRCGHLWVKFKDRKDHKDFKE